ncbi:MAG: TolC family protein [Chitinophagaceae bacterium]|nr:TolC family protein [Chitinophagaceae bacterium]
MKNNVLLLCIICTTWMSSVCGQEKWSLKRCVDYAITNNISVKQMDVQRRFEELNFRQTRATNLPTASFSNNTGYGFGRNTDPTTNVNTSQQILSQNFSLSTNITIFNWNRIRNNILSADLANQAAYADVEKTRNDIALNVATTYLQALLAKEQIRIVSVQVQQTVSQLSDVRKRVNAGAIPELDALQLESQLAQDSSNLITAIANADLNLLQLKALMNLDIAASFDIEVPPVETIPLESIADLQPDIVYQLALKNQPAQKANELRYRSFQYDAKAAKAALYPSFSAYGALGTSFASQNRKITGITFNDYSAVVPGFPGDAVNIGGQFVPVQSPVYNVKQETKSFGEYWSGWGNQIENNFGQNLGISINIPIFNAYASRTAYQRSRINIDNQQLVKEQADQKLKQDIYTAYTNAYAALRKFNASKVGVTTSQKAYDFSQKRYDLGLLSTFDLIISQNTLARAKLDLSNAQYDYVFKMKVLEFYKGIGLKL